MSESTVIHALDLLLTPLGFTRQQDVWNRGRGSVVQVIGAQFDKARSAVTINAGVLDTEVYVTVWRGKSPAFVEEPHCTVRVRVGELIDGKDRWWDLDDRESDDEIAREAANHVLPFVARMRSRREMAQWLMDTQVVKKKYPLPIINLAVLQSLLGESSDACRLLTDLQRSAVGLWRTRAVEVAARLGCAG